MSNEPSVFSSAGLTGLSRALLVIAVAIAAATACAEPRSTDDRPEESRVLALIDGEPVTMADLSERVGDQLAQLDVEYRRQRHQMLEGAVESLVHDRLLQGAAAERGSSVDEYVAAETDVDLEVSDADVADFYERNRASLGGRSLDQLAPRIREFLENQAREQSMKQVAGRLVEERDVVYLLGPFRAELDNGGAPAQGPENAPITVVEFSDFQCPYCARFVPTLKRIKEQYGDRVRIIYRQFPIPEIHPNAIKAAEASLCADEQGRFWEMHDLLFAEQASLDVEALKDKADRLGLEREAFAECLDSGRQAQRLERDRKEGTRIGITGTPAIFINGIQVPGGAVPFEVVAGVIEDELQRIGAR